MELEQSVLCIWKKIVEQPKTKWAKNTQTIMSEKKFWERFKKLQDYEAKQKSMRKRVWGKKK